MAFYTQATGGGQKVDFHWHHTQWPLISSDRAQLLNFSSHCQPDSIRASCCMAGNELHKHRTRDNRMYVRCQGLRLSALPDAEATEDFGG